MNYLAHAYLSFGDPELLVGNMISDFIKGKRKFEYSEGIQKGIVLHRLIDTFTDTHEATREAAKYFKPSVGLYAGAFIDIVYDHFLALDTNEKSEDEWKQFSQDTYSVLLEFQNILPERFSKLLPHMISHDWLFNYRYITGIENSFKGLVHRAKYLENSDNAFVAFKTNYDFLRYHYTNFFPHVKDLVSSL